MTRVDELKNKIVDLKNNAETLKNECKIDEALEVVNSIKDLKKELEVEEALNEKEVKEIENKLGGDVINMKKTELLNKEEKLFVDFIRGGIANDMEAGDNGAIIPNSISSQIIAKVEEISPLYARATKFNVGGELTFVKEDAIPTCAYMDEMAEGTGTDATFQTVKLGAFIARALTKISRSLINRTDFDLLQYVVEAVAKSIARFLEKELIVGTSSKIDGLSKVVATEVTAINADAYVDLQMAVPSALQGGCEWLMNTADLKAARKFKTIDGQYLLNADATKEFGWAILGKNVMISDQVPAGTIYYGDFSGLYVKLANDVEVSVLKERYAEQYAYGVVGFVELDAKVVEIQKIVAMKKQGE
ncbi:MAG: phage major capsid protein [Clostridium celatum]|nr:phage major capsid protein [Clostridium celatum]